VVVDVGGGAGRYSLPLASRCREVVNVDPSAAMGAAFAANAARRDRQRPLRPWRLADERRAEGRREGEARVRLAAVVRPCGRSGVW
jgi:SAM-dependent methyltransferase